MKYILNKIPVKTTNSFNLNALNIDLNIPVNYSFKEFQMINSELFDVTYSINNNLNSKIGLSFDKYLNLDIIVKNNIDKPLVLSYDFANEENLVDNLNISFTNNSNASIIIKYNSLDNTKTFHHLNMNIDMKDNSYGNISIINNLNDISTNLFAINNNLNNNSKLDLNVFDIGANIKISNIYSLTNMNATSNLNNIYLGMNNDIIDMNYEYINNQTCSTNNINIEGLLNDFAKKSFKGTINFIKGAKEANGFERENTILLSDNIINSSVPLLLCGEEDVTGAHGVSSGKIDQDKLFYLESKGIDLEDAKKIICMANFNNVLKNIDNIDLQNELIEIIDKKIMF